MKQWRCLLHNPPSEEDWSFARRLHGHLGPWLALGMRIGSVGVRTLGARPHFGVELEARIPARPPVSCLLDGLQLSTGSTLGKRNISVVDSGDMVVTLIDRDTQGRLEIHLAPGLCERFKALMAELGEEEAAREVWRIPLSDLMTICEAAKTRLTRAAVFVEPTKLGAPP